MGLFKKKAPVAQEKKSEYGLINRVVRNAKAKSQANHKARTLKEVAEIKFNKIKNALRLRPAKVKITYEVLSKEYSSAEIKKIDQKLAMLEKRAEESHKRIQELKGGFIKDNKNIEVINRKKIAQQLLKGQEVKKIPKRNAINPESLEPNKGTKASTKTLKEIEAGDRKVLKIRELDKHFTSEKKRAMVSKEIRKEIENARLINKEIASIQSIKFNDIIKNQLKSFGTIAETKQAREAIIKSLYNKYEKGAINLSGLRDLIKYLSVEIEIGKKMNVINSVENANTYLLGNAQLINEIKDITEIKKKFKFF
ncbi:MAG: hypothetical protein PHX47_04345 [Candidatus ainarchaeum sp.]|nr:hypothetical protein [Candidatus ainarchaeum sp.]